MITFTPEEQGILVSLVGQLDAERYPHPSAKSVIFKAAAAIKAAEETEGGIRIRWAAP